MALVASLNADPDVDGILVQIPLPRHRDSEPVTQSILPEHPRQADILVAAADRRAGMVAPIFNERPRVCPVETSVSSFCLSRKTLVRRCTDCTSLCGLRPVQPSQFAMPNRVDRPPQLGGFFASVSSDGCARQDWPVDGRRPTALGAQHVAVTSIPSIRKGRRRVMTSVTAKPESERTDRTSSASNMRCVSGSQNGHSCMVERPVK